MNSTAKNSAAPKIDRKFAAAVGAAAVAAIQAAALAAGVGAVMNLDAPAAVACDTCESDMKPGTYTGGATRLGNGVAYTWVTLNGKGKPDSVGVTITETALEGLPVSVAADGPPVHEFMLMLPKEAKKTAFDHVSVDWNPKGHPPLNVYDKPHLDIHFYTVTQGERQKITAQGADLARCNKPVPAKFAPVGYIQAPDTAVPMMGSHWVDPTSPELAAMLSNGAKPAGPFTKTFLYGSYDGKLAFYEPMITQEWLATKPQHAEEIKLPAAYEKSGYYPTRYSVRHDAARREYTIALEGLVWREGVEQKKTAASAVKPAAAKAPVVARVSKKGSR